MTEEELSDESSRDEHRSGRCRSGLGWADIGMSRISLDYSRDSGIETVSIRVKGLLNWEND